MSSLAWVIGALLSAYLLPGPMILRQMAVRRSEMLPASFEVQGTLRLHEATGTGLAEDLRAKVSFSSGRCRWHFDGDKPLEIVNDRGKIDGSEPRWAVWLAKLGCEPFLGSASPGGILEQELRSGGDDFDAVALVRRSGEIAYVLGAGENGSGRTGLIVAKKGLVPLRFYMEEKGVRVGCDFRRYEATFRAGAFPRQIDLTAGDTVVASFVSKSD
jgi:hypothetical protein